ncbi:QcrA and Rieske domain-containing protein [Fibrella aquatilis]|uniref:Rieske (2Fe-2S) protein n=1 Tax=Fibrella aquatilis TaxID=2817059 RepID=A0A939G2W5_9BACT|nr:Rieske (2Fe-2S) protein [Fibrella aquatilis]MBO0931069.1 Rieske (2Fe-2S) protein [Fibrella aquatilis]
MKTQSEDQTTLSRGDFMRSLGLSSAALMAFYCMGTTMTSCKSSDPAPVTPTPPVGGGGSTGITGTTTGSAIDFTLDLTNANLSTLKTEGNFSTIGDVLVIKVKGGSYVALQKLCTHAQLEGLSYRLATDDIKCSNHNSEFKTDGSVNKGPATTALKKYTTTLSTDGNKLQVKA